MGDHRPQVLFVCVHNAGRSQMAAALLAHHGGDRVVVRSAGTAPAEEINEEVTMSRVQLALNVTDVDAAVDFYSKLFATPVQAQARLRQLRDRRAAPQAGAHRGRRGRHAQPPRRRDRDRSRGRRRRGPTVEDGLQTTGVDDTDCCYATKTETWVTDPDGAKWEWYVKTGDAEQMANSVIGSAEGTCCAPAPFRRA
jgi:hypothetical protein